MGATTKVIAVSRIKHILYGSYKLLLSSLKDEGTWALEAELKFPSA